MATPRANHRYTEDDDVAIMMIRRQGKTYAEIAERMGRGFTENGIRHRARHLRHLGLMPTRKKSPQRPKEEKPKPVVRPSKWAASLWVQAMHRASSIA